MSYESTIDRICMVVWLWMGARCGDEHGDSVTPNGKGYKTMSDESYPGEAAASDHVPDARKMVPTPLTREQVEKLVRHHTIGWGPHSKVNLLLDHDVALRQALTQRNAQIEKLASYIITNVPGEPSRSEGAVETAIRIIAQQAQEIERLKVEVADQKAKQAACVAELAASQARERELEVRKDGAYLERNHLVAALARCFPSGIRKTAIEGWSDDWHGCVYIDLPAGQISYHYHDSQAFLFEALPAYTKLYDGHTKDDVHERLKSATLQATLAEREQKIQELEAGRLKDALRFYADPHSYGISGGTNERIIQDHGQKAQRALMGE